MPRKGQEVQECDATKGDGSVADGYTKNKDQPGIADPMNNPTYGISKLHGTSCMGHLPDPFVLPRVFVLVCVINFHGYTQASESPCCLY